MKKIIATPSAPTAIGPYSQACRLGTFIACSGQIPIDPATGQLVPGDITAQTRQVLKNLVAVLSAAGAAPQDVMKTTVFLTDLDNFQAMNAVYTETFGSNPPARSTIQISALPMGALVEIEALAMLESEPASRQV